MNNQEIEEEKRKRQLAIIKATNEMLEDTKKRAMKHTSDPIRRTELESRFNRAIGENESMAKSYLHATMEEVENAEYREVDPSEVIKYNERLKKRGLTDEEVHRKESATVTIGKTEEDKSTRRRRRGAKDTSEIVRLDNEEELMRQSMANDDSLVEKHIQENKEYEQRMINEGRDIIKKTQKKLQEETAKKKINVEDNIQNERVEVKNVSVKENIVKNEEVKEEVKDAVVKNVSRKKKDDEKVLTYDFDFSSVPSYVQYDVIPLPSKGECYPIDSPLRCGRIPVAYLTAADENIMVSPNVYRDGKLLDIMLKRKVLDKRIDTNCLCSGDRDAIILWLRGTSYGEEFPITSTNPETGKHYNVTLNLSQFDYNDFDLVGDEEGLFDYETNNGDLIKFKIFTNKDEEELKKTITSQVLNVNKVDILRNINFVSDTISRMNFNEEERTMLQEDIDEIKDIVNVDVEDNLDNLYANTITEQMVMYTVSINGNNNREYVRNYIENMRAKSAMDYRNYVANNKPGVDFSFTINIPESDGGGSFNSFLRIDDTIFINF